MSASIPESGFVYSFRTVPYSKFAPTETNRYAALKILGCNKKNVVAGVLNSIWNKPPSLGEAASCNLLREHRFFYTDVVTVWGMNADWFNLTDLAEMTFIGSASLNAEETRLAARNLKNLPGSRFSTISLANYAAEGEWRWANDREALIAEQKLVDAEKLAKEAAEIERQKNRLSKLTWDQLLEENPFEGWSPSPPYPPVEFTQEARRVVHGTCRAIRELGSKPRKADVRRLMRECVEWFNKADDQAGHVIETVEREDVFEVLEEIVYVARHKSLIEEISEWRTW